MINWLDQLNKLGILDWFSTLDDEERVALIINAVAKHLLGEVSDYMPVSCFTPELRRVFRKYDCEDWYTILLGLNMTEGGNFVGLNEIMVVLLEESDTLEVNSLSDTPISEDELRFEVNAYYQQWRKLCLNAFSKGLSNEWGGFLCASSLS